MEGDGRSNASIASNPSLKSSAISQDRLAKFRELQRRRLQIQTKSKNKRKSKDKKDKFVSDDVDTQGSVDDHLDEYEGLKHSSVKCSPKGEDDNKVLSSTSRVDVHPALKKKKLHWGLDAKERWERKANM
ncbi:uncharacterized protein LOC110728227 [Chenopodium quinoa]|uniref:uncharacterized protein LOC110728227 n=1 Tax=Chenopodium quinoa TaxID=63459 RepID=UPI000B77F4A3|nr:uncharacterized protein LOC110728227 [Chenopodium quinoa]